MGVKMASHTEAGTLADGLKEYAGAGHKWESH
jgi:hypothetical protein